MNINWNKIFEAFKTLNDAKHEAMLLVDKAFDKPRSTDISGPDRWVFDFKGLTWPARRAAFKHLFRASFSVLFLGRCRITLQRKKNDSKP